MENYRDDIVLMKNFNDLSRLSFYDDLVSFIKNNKLSDIDKEKLKYTATVNNDTVYDLMTSL